MTASLPAASGRWLFGPAPDLLLGCGGLYALIFLVSVWAGPLIRGNQADLLFPLLVLAISYPHYGATLLRVYENRKDRRGYALFAVHLTLVLAAAFVAALYIPFVGVLLVTIFLTWSPWHYTGQNYGLALLFLRRRGVEIDDTTKRWIYTSFITSFLLTAVVMHEATGANVDNLLSIYRADAIRFQPLGIPLGASRLLVLGLGSIYLLAIVVAALRLLRRSRASDLLPAGALAGTQALWFAIPFALRHTQTTVGVEPLDWDFRLHYFVWIALGHAIQYLWITSYYAKRSGNWSGLSRYYAKVSMSGIALWTVPVVLFSASFMGGPSFEAGLGILVASVVNIHHFILDGAIWKLRHNRIGNVLIRDREEAAGAEYAGPQPRFGRRRLVWSLATLGALGAVAAFWLEEISYPTAMSRYDLVAAGQSLDALGVLGRDSAARRNQLGIEFSRKGEDAAALRHLETSVALRPQPQAFTTIGQLANRKGDWKEALSAFESALSLAPDQPDILRLAAAAADRSGDAEKRDQYRKRAAGLQGGGDSRETKPSRKAP